MIKRFLLPASTVIFGCLVLIISLANASEINLNISDLKNPLPAGPLRAEQFFVNYELPNASSSPIPFMTHIYSARDRVQLMTSFSKSAKAQTMLDHSNRRLALGEVLIREGEIKDGLITIFKSQEYLLRSYELAQQLEGTDQTILIREISLASLKHRERMESLMAMMPDESRPLIVSNLDKAKIIYNQTKIALQGFGEVAPPSPFDN